MKRALYIFIFLLTLTLFSGVQAQVSTAAPDVVGSAGGASTDGASNNWQWTIGETVIFTGSATTKTFTQGFNQPDNCPTQAFLNYINDTTLCDGDSIQLVVEGFEGYTFSWYDESNSIVQGPAVDDSIAVIFTKGSYHARLESATCTFFSDTIDITISEEINAQLTISGDTLFCEGDSVTLSVEGGSTYQWLDNNIAVGGETDSALIAKTLGSFSVEISQGSCVDTSRQVSVATKASPSIGNISVDRDSICTTDTLVTHSDGVNSSSAVYQWETSSDDVSWTPRGVGLPDDTLTGFAVGDYLLRAYVEEDGCADTSLKEVFEVVNCDQFPDFSADILDPCMGDTVIFTDVSSGYTTSAVYLWDFGTDASPATATGPGPHRVVYTSSGAKDVSLEVEEDSRTLTESKIGYLTVQLATIPTVSSGGGDLCTGTSVNLISNGTSGNVQWFLNDSLKLVGATEPTYTALLPGEYNVVIATGACAVVSSSVTVDINPSAVKPVITVNTNPTTLSTSAGPVHRWYAEINGELWRIAGANNPVFRPYYNGKYVVSIGYGTNCIRFSDVEVVSIPGADDITRFADNSSGKNILLLPEFDENYASLTMYPSPASDVIHMTYTSPSSQTVHLVVSDPLSKAVFEKTWMKGSGISTVEIDVSSWSAGVYIVRMIDGNEVSTQKIVVRR